MWYYVQKWLINQTLAPIFRGIILKGRNMKETIQYIYQEIRIHNVNVNDSIDFMFMPVKKAKRPINVQCHFEEAIQDLLNRNILALREVEGKQDPFLTEQGFKEIYR